MDTVIHVENLTKDYGEGRGVFGLNFDIKRGEVFGFVGTNGSGKTTTIRNVMGFIKPTEGKVTVDGLDSWEDATRIKNLVSYVPGEIAFPSLLKGTDFLKSQAGYLGIKDTSYMNELVEKLKLDPTAGLSRMSKGMKQKTAIVAAMMGNKEILILDEPTTGLDPLMREVFMDLLKEHKAQGKTIFMSSHIFEEVEEICDRVALIKDGRIIDIVDMGETGMFKTTVYDVCFSNENDRQQFDNEIEVLGSEMKIVSSEERTSKVRLPRAETKALFEVLTRFEIKSIHEEKRDLEAYFGEIYKGGGDR